MSSSASWALTPPPVNCAVKVTPALPPAWVDPRLPDALEAHAARLPSPQSTLARHVLGTAERLRVSGTVALFADDVEAYLTAVLDQGLALHPEHRILVEGFGKMLADLARGRPSCGRWLVLSLGSSEREARHRAEVAAIVDHGRRCAR